MSAALVTWAAAQLDRLAPRDATIVVAVSGGPDSLALLDLLHGGRELHGRPLVVGHVDHGIDPSSGDVARMVADHAARYGIPFHVKTLALGPSATETAARRARRGALRAIATVAGAKGIALAHHAQDQAETVLLRVLGGTGPAGLAGMAARRGPWLRPVLTIDPRELAAHLASVGLSAWQDPANSDPRHLRSWLRIAALPLLQQRFKGLTDSLGAVAAQAARDRAAWNQVPALLPALDLRHERGTISVAAPPLRGYRSEVQDAVLSALARRFGVPIGSRRRAGLRRLVSAGRSGARLALGPALEAELTFDRLELRRPVEVAAAAALPPNGVVQVGAARFAVRGVVSEGILARTGWHTELAAGGYLIRSWRPGDRIRPLGGTGSRAVAELFKEARVATGARRGWPVLVPAEHDATIVWVPGICRSGERVPSIGKEALDVECDLA